jgi:hypothetical protein
MWLWWCSLFFYTSACGDESKTFRNVPAGWDLEIESWRISWEVPGKWILMTGWPTGYPLIVSHYALQHGLAWDGEGRATTSLAGPRAAHKGNCCLLPKWLGWTLFTMVSANPSCWVSNLAHRPHPNESWVEEWLISCHVYHHPVSFASTLPWPSVFWAATFKTMDHILHHLSTTLHHTTQITASSQGLFRSQTVQIELIKQKGCAPKTFFTVFTWDFLFYG